MKNKLVLMTGLFSFFLYVGAVESEAVNSLETYEKIDSEVSIRPWDTKDSGKVIDHQIISVIKTKSGKGNIVILKWAKTMDTFDVEVYKSESESKLFPGKIDTWQIANSKVNKTLSNQHDHFYMIQYSVPGAEGGIVSQTFKLP